MTESSTTSSLLTLPAAALGPHAWRSATRPDPGTPCARPVPPAPGGFGRRSDLWQLVCGPGMALTPELDGPVPTRRLRPGEALFHQGRRPEASYIVRAGTFKVFNTTEDGYEQVLGLRVRADLLGFDALCGNVHVTSAVALEDASVYVLLAPGLAGWGQGFPGMDRLLALAASRALCHCNEQAEIMAAVSAEGRLARFLLHWSHRMVDCGQSPCRFLLRMGRRDIASQLGVAHETVSRSFQNLARWQLLRVNNREVEILDLPGLRELARSTRRPSDDTAPTVGLAHGGGGEGPAADPRAEAAARPLPRAGPPVVHALQVQSWAA